MGYLEEFRKRFADAPNPVFESATALQQAEYALIMAKCFQKPEDVSRHCAVKPYDYSGAGKRVDLIRRSF